MKKTISNICNFFKKYKEYFLSFLFGFIIILAIFLLQGMWFQDKSMILSDCFGQYYEMFYYLKDILNGTKSVFYSFQIGGGTGMIATIAYYLISPFNLLILLFDYNHIQIAMHIIIMLKIASSILTMFILLRSEYKKTDYWVLLAFALCYGLSDFALGYEFDFIWFDALYLLPLVILGINKIVDQKKPFLYFITLFLTVMCNYYMGYMVCIFSVIYFIYRLFIKYDFKNDKKLMLKTTNRYIMSTLCAGLMTFFIMYPTFLVMRSMGRTDINNLTSIGFFSIDVLSKMFCVVKDSDVLNKNVPYLYCGLINIVLPIMFFFNKGINKKERLWSLALLSFLILSLFFKPLYYMWHVFSTPSSFAGRFSFLIIFYIILLSVREIENIKYSKPFEYLFSSLFITLLSLFMLFNKPDYLDLASIYGTAFGSMFYLFLLYLYNNYNDEQNKKSLKKMVIFLMIGELFFNAYVLLNAFSKNSYLQVQEFPTILKDGYSQIKDDSFYRIADSNNLSMISALFTDKNSASIFSSTASSDMLPFAIKLGYNEYSNAFKYHNSITKLTDTILNVKYVFNNEDNYKNYIDIGSYKYSMTSGILYNAIKTDYRLLRNDSTFGIATLSSSEPLNSLYSNSLDFQNLIFRTITGMNKNVFDKIDLHLTNDGSEFIVPDNQYIYIDLPRIDTDVDKDIYINNTIIFTRKDKDNLYGNEVEYFKNEFQPGEKAKLKVKSNGNNVYINQALYVFNEDVFNEGVKIMQSHALQNVAWSDGYIKGTVNATEDFGVLFISIPYENGWTAYVDGNKTDVKEVYDGMMSVSLTPGEHTIELKYQTPGLLIGAIITIISLVGYLVYYRYKEFMDNLFSSVVIKCSKFILEFLHRILFIIISLVVYIIFFSILKLPALSCVTIAWLFVIAYKYATNRDKAHKDFESIVKDILLCVKEDGIILLLELYLMYKLVYNFGESYAIYLMSVIFANLIIFLIKKIIDKD